uniref:Transposase n=1 Tax=Heterorhabditis bacteriophora TaxID=37862 RepID=A0A1I7WPB9_HETBA
MKSGILTGDFQGYYVSPQKKLNHSAHTEQKKCKETKCLMATDELLAEKDFDRIDAELGEDHLLRMIRCLVADSPAAMEGLYQLHNQAGMDRGCNQTARSA